MSERWTPLPGTNSADRATFRRVGATHLCLAAFANVATGLTLAYLATTGRLLQSAFVRLRPYASDVELLQMADTVALLATTGAVPIAGALVVIGGGAAAVGWRAFADASAPWGVFASVVTMLNPLTLPLGIIAGTLLYLGRPAVSETADRDRRR